MKRKLSLLIVLLFATSAFALENPWDTKLPFKNAIINYNLSGTMSGEKTTYIKDYGRTTAEYSNTSMKMFGMTQQQKEIIITTPDWVYTIDLMEKIGTKQANPKKFMIQEFNNLSKAEKKKVIKNSESLGVSTIEGMDGTLEKNAEKILGYMCDKVSMAGTDTYIFSGTDLPLKVKGETMGIKIDQTATSIKKESASSSKFELPSNIQLEHNEQADQMMQDRAKTIIQTILENKHSKSADTSPQMSAPQPPANESNQMTPEMQEQMKQMMEILGKQGG